MAKVIQMFPDVVQHVRPNGDSVVELCYGDQVVGEINFTKLFTRVGQALGWIHPPGKPVLKMVP